MACTYKTKIKYHRMYGATCCSDWLLLKIDWLLPLEPIERDPVETWLLEVRETGWTTESGLVSSKNGRKVSRVSLSRDWPESRDENWVIGKGKVHPK